MGPSSIRLGETTLAGPFDYTDTASDGKTTFMPRSCIHEEIFATHFIPSGRIGWHWKYGIRKYYHLVVDLSEEEKDTKDEKTRIVENAAWYYDGSRAGELKDMISFRITRAGDPGNPHSNMWAMPEGDGVTEVQDWFG